MPNPFTVFSGANNSALTSALLAPNSGILINETSIVLNASGSDAVNFYDGSLSPLGIGSGLLLTSGTTPGTNNTVGWFGQDNHLLQYLNGDTDINAVVSSVFSSYSYDATTLSFDFTATDPTATSVSFDVVFGSDEFPEWVDQFVDCAVVMVNGVNYALFNHDPLHPLSVVSSNLAAGYFQDNAVDPVTGLSLLPIEYDGVSHVLKIVAPITAGGAINHIKIGIADTGDHIYDSGIFLSNFTAGNTPGSGLVAPTDTCTDSNDSVTGSTQDEYFDLKGGDDTVYAGGGDDIVVAGNGNDVVYGGSGNDELKGGSGDDFIDGGDGTSDVAVYAGASTGYGVAYNGVFGSFTIADSNVSLSSEGVDTLQNVEYVKFSDGLFAIGVDGLKPATPIGTPPHINTPGTLAIGGIGSVGNTLTAMLNDVDGVSGPINYQWQISSDKGATWSDISGAVNNTYLLSNSDGDKHIQVTASYIDNDSQAEAPVSIAKEIFAPAVGDLTVTLMKLDAPPGTSIINPLTTLLQNGIELGLSPNEATLKIKSVLGIPQDVKLQSYDAYAVLQSAPQDPTALAVEKVAIQVAILTSLSDDDTGMNLTLSIFNAAANNKTLDLGSLDDICFILGVDPQGSLSDSVSVIFNRNKSMSDSIADGGDVNDIEKEWVDICGINDGINSTSIADLSIHVNQAPTGGASLALNVAVQNDVYSITASDLLQGFSDPDGGTLEVSSLSVDTGGTLQDNGDGTWSFTPDSGYTGPVELSYTINDGQGASISAAQLFVVTEATAGPVNNAPTGDVVITGEFIRGQTLTADVSTIADADGLGEISYQWQADGFDILGATGSSFTLTKAEVGHVITVMAIYTDLLGSIESLVSSATTVVTAPLGKTLTGTAGNDALNGGAGDDTLTGLVGNDMLNGGEGDDTLEGGTGNDSYYIDSVDDVVVELVEEGTDRVYTNVNYTLSLNVEHLTLLGMGDINGTGNSGKNVLTGNSGNNLLIGAVGDDSLIGGAGADSLIGGADNDTYYVDDAGDMVTELGGDGIDTVYTKLSHTLSDNVENLFLQRSGAINGTGNSMNNSITGNDDPNVVSGGGGNDTLYGGGGTDTLNGDSGNDVLDGGADNDSLNGGAGNDALLGGWGADQLFGDSGRDVFTYRNDRESGTTEGTMDVILDFTTGQDKIKLTGVDANSEVSGKQAFSQVILTGADSFSSAGQLKFDSTAHILYGNTDSDIEADFAIVVAGVTNIKVSDIIF
ncbi:MAG: cadherin-like domain-containing protein [Chlorobiaceae bacterium]|nr:cadherin-like domain-containing protein [Chlorobiaceae bacterium]